MSLRITWVALQCSMAALVGCGGGGDQVCTTDDQCASHFCRADGTCGAAGDPDAGSGSGSNDGGTTGLCTPNHDGKIQANEVPLAAGKMANFRIAKSATWNTAGTAGTGGTRIWNLAGSLSNDADQPVVLDAPTGWWAADTGFATATYAVTLAAGSDTLGVFHVDDTGVTLLGLVSPTKSTPYTEVTYDPPARILSVPFGASDTWTSSSTVSGYLGTTGYVNYTEKYVSDVDQTGTMTTPYGDFPVLRVGTVLTELQLTSQFRSVRSYAWVAECFGTVASVTSTDNEAAAEFSSDAEVRRLIP